VWVYRASPEPVTATNVRTVTDTTTSTVETTPPETFAGLLGGNVVQDLLDQGIVGEATPVEPKSGWETEFELDVADADIRFKHGEAEDLVEWEYLQTAAGNQLDAEIRRITEARGYEPIP
jgi:hypothetical protein